MKDHGITNTAYNGCILDIRIQREKLRERLNLEVVLTRGLRLLGLCLCMFIVVVYAAILEADSSGRLGLLKTYKTLFALDDLKDMRTPEEFSEYLALVSKISRALMPASSNYFVEQVPRV